MEILIELVLLAAVLNCLAVQVLIFKSLQKGQSVPAEEILTPEEQEARRMAAEAQAKYEQGFVNLMAYTGMPAGKKEGMFG